MHCMALKRTDWIIYIGSRWGGGGGGGGGGRYGAEIVRGRYGALTEADRGSDRGR